MSDNAGVAPPRWSQPDIRAVFERRIRADPRLSGGTPAEIATLRAAVMRPEFEPFRASLRARIDDTCSGRWEIGPDGTLRIGRATLVDPVLAALELRFALELSLLERLAPDGPDEERRPTLWLLALHTMLSYYLQMTASERATVRGAAGPGLAHALAAAHSRSLLGMPSAERCRVLLGLVTGLAGEYPGAGALNAAAHDIACRRAASLLALAHPAERLLTMGGDDRLLVDEDTGLNGYGCSPRPRPWAITFSSSTASSVSEQAFSQVEAMRQEALRAGLAGALVAHLDALGRETRSAIAATLTIERGEAEIVLSASGTDAELIALWLAMGRAPGRPVLNVIVGPEEIGSGSVPAAGGRHFNPQSPLGGAVAPGEMLAGFPSGRIRVEMLPVRDASGSPLGCSAIDTALERLVSAAVASGETVLLHLVDCSKTGLMAPSLASVERLVARHQENVVVVVDAAQMRISREMLRHYCAAGFIVLITGSKFFTGPPFSGAVLVPAGTLRTLPGLVALPAGIAAYATAGDFPEAFGESTGNLPAGCNIGLLARWRAALWEMTAFYAVPRDARRATIAAFEATLRQSVADLPELELLPPPRRERNPDGGWDSLPSIFTYLLRLPGGAAGYEDGRRVYLWLNSDISGRLPTDANAEERALARRCCHTPQPVKLARKSGSAVAGMRIAAGARLVSGVHFDPMLGATATERLQSELCDMQTVLRKAALIARRWEELRDEPPQSRLQHGGTLGA